MAQPASNLSIAAWLYRALALFAAAACAITLAAWPIVRAYNSGRIDTIEAREKGYVEAAVLDAGNAVHEVAGDLRVAANLPAMKQFLVRAGTAEYGALADALRNIMEAYGRYERIRLLDNDGRQMMHVANEHGRTVVVEPDALQVGAEYVLARASELERGDIDISALELARENGAVAVPQRWIFRVATPVFESAGGRKGLLVFDVDARALTERIRQVMKTDPQHETMLLDANGRRIDTDEETSAAVSLPHAAADLALIHAAEWATISSSNQGAIRSAAGLFVFATIPLRDANADVPRQVAVTGASAPAASNGWKVVSFIPQDTLARRSLLHLPLGRDLFAMIYLLLLALSLLLAYITLFLERARESERIAAREIEDLYERAPCGYHSLDRRGLIVRMNQTELNWLGYRADEVIGKKHITDLLSEQGRVIFHELFPRFLRTDQLIDLELDFVRKDGSLLPVVVSASAVRDGAGNYVMSRSTVFDATERRKFESELVRQAHTDVLTGIGNRRQFFELAARELSRSNRSGSPLALLLLDIDDFKRINDQHGHEAGDAVLKSFAATVAAALRDVDIFARLGGEEFAILLPDTDSVAARAVAERIRRQVSLVVENRQQGQALSFTVSIGVAALIPGGEADSIDAMLRRADAALYQAKNAGRNRVRSSA